MLKALIKKQLLELNSFYFRSRKTGQRRTKMGTLLFAGLFALLFVYLGFVFYMMADGLIGPFMSIGQDWMYFGLMGLLAVVLGTFGSVFNTYAGLYLAKDNELLMAMPIPSTRIITARLVGVTVTGVLYELVVLIPAIIVRVLHSGVGAMQALGMLAVMVDVALLVTVFTCLLGWIVALIATRIKGRSWVTVLLSLAFIVGYYMLIGNSYKIVPMLIGSVTTGGGAKIKGWLFLFSMMGEAAEGSVSDMLLLTGISLLAMAATWAALARSFVYIASRNGETASRRTRRFNVAGIRAGSLQRALLAKEWRRFTSSATYMLNTGMASLLVPVLVVAAVVKRADIKMVLRPLLIGMPILGDLMPLLLTAVICMMAGMNFVTAPSVSLEGRSLWVVQTMPVPAAKVLWAKVQLHMLVTLPVMLVSGGVLAWVMTLDVLPAVLMLVCVSAFTLLCAESGLALNLKLPNLTWTNEVAPIKQSMSTMIEMFGSWALVAALGGLYYLLRSLVTPMAFLAMAAAVLAALDALLALWINGRGAAIFEKL